MFRALPLAAAMVACSGKTPLPPTFVLGAVDREVGQGVQLSGELSGLLSGNQVVVRLKGGEQLTLTANGAFTFTTVFGPGDGYEVELVSAPALQTCTLSGGSGVVDTAALAVTCTAEMFSLGGTVSGLSSGSSLQVAVNGGETVQIDATGPFSFPTKIPAGTSYELTIINDVTGHDCEIVAGATGMITTRDIAEVEILCTLVFYPISASVVNVFSSGLVLRNNNTDDTPVLADGTVFFTTMLAYGSPYEVSIASPAPGLDCVVQNGIGTAGISPTIPTIVCALAKLRFVSHPSRPDNGGNSYPWGTGDMTYQGLYYPANFNFHGGRVVALRVHTESDIADGFGCDDRTIRLGHSTVTDLSSTYSANFNLEAPMIVRTGAHRYPATNNDWIEVPLTTPFDYNGGDNVVLQVNQSGCTSPPVYFTSSSGPGTTMRQYASGNANAVTSSGGDAGVPWLDFVIEGGERFIRASGANDSNIPVAIAPASSGRTQFLIAQEDLDGSGVITGIQFDLSGSPTGTGTYKMTLSHVSPFYDEVSATFSDNVGSNPKVVADNLTITFAPNMDKLFVPMNEPYIYDGSSNLLIDIEATITGGSGSFYYDSRPSVYRTVSGAIGDTLGYQRFRSLEPVLRFHGGGINIVDSIGLTSTSSFFPDSGADAVTTVIAATQIGMRGTITEIACRAAALTTAATYPGYFIRFATKTDPALGTMATDFASPANVFSGSYSVAGGIQANGWIRFPLTTPFTYDGVSSLVVTMGSTLAGTAPNACQLSGTTASHASQLGIGASNYDTVLDRQAQLQLTINR